MRMYGLTSLTDSQNKALKKLDELDARASKEGKKIEIWKTPTGLSLKGPNKNNMIKDLPILSDYSLVERYRHKTKKGQIWNYYALSEIGEIIVIKKKIMEIVSDKESSFEDEKTNLDYLKNRLELVSQNWDKVKLEFGDFSYWCLRQSILSFDFFTRWEFHLNFVIISIQISLPSKNGCSFTHIEKFHQCFIENKNIESGFDLKDVGIVNPAQFKIDYDEKGREKINEMLRENLKKNINDFLTYSFYSYLVGNIHMIKNAVKTFHKESKNYKPDNYQEYKIQEDKIKSLGNKFLKWFGDDFTNNDFDKIIDKLEDYENKAQEIIKDSNLNFHLKRIQETIEETNFHPLIDKIKNH